MRLDPQDVAARLGRNVRAYRKYRRISQEKLSILLDGHGITLTSGQISDTENGKRFIRLPELIALVRILDCTFSDLIGYDPKGH